jgi:hypothetical protein
MSSMVKKLIESVRSAIKSKNHYAALYTALALPDICCAIEYGTTTARKYSDWWNKHAKYSGFLNGDDCYALRCAALHEGRDDITSQRMKDALDYYIFLTSGSHCTLFKDHNVNGKKSSFLQLNVEKFCEDICDTVDAWMFAIEKTNDPEIQKRMRSGIDIHNPGYVHLGVIEFS